LSYPGAVPEV